MDQNSNCVTPPTCTPDRVLDWVTLKCVCKQDIIDGRCNDEANDDDNAVLRICREIDYCENRYCDVLFPFAVLSRCQFDGCCWVCPDDCIQIQNDWHHHKKRSEITAVKRSDNSDLNYRTTNYPPFSSQCPYIAGPFPPDNYYVDRTAEAFCLSFIRHDPLNPDLCGLSCLDDPCQSFSCGDCILDSRCRWKRYVFTNGSQVVPYGICELSDDTSGPSYCYPNDVNALPDISSGVQIATSAFEACVFYCAKQKNLNAVCSIQQILQATSTFLNWLLYMNTMGPPTRADLDGCVACVAECVAFQIWPGYYVGPSVTDVTTNVRKRSNDQLGTTTTILHVSTVNNGPITNGGEIAGIVVASLFGAFVLIVVLLLVYLKWAANRPRYCAEHDMYHLCQ